VAGPFPPLTVSIFVPGTLLYPQSRRATIKTVGRSGAGIAEKHNPSLFGATIHMYKRLILTCLLASLAAEAAAALDTVTAADTKTFHELDVKLWHAWITKLNPADAAPFYSKKPGNLYFDISPLKFVGWNEYQRVTTQTLAGGGHATVNIHDDFTVIKQGDLVVTAFTFDLSFAPTPGAPVSVTAGRETDVWAKENGKWLIVHQHMSTPSGDGAPSPQP
jgi:ketosteroid isomerase-like protein